MSASDKMHGVAKFDVATGKQFKGKGGGPLPLTSVFANELVKFAEEDPSVRECVCLCCFDYIRASGVHEHVLYFFLNF